MEMQKRVPFAMLWGYDIFRNATNNINIGRKG